jgi:endonuclease YncB( thermonuclease family)
VKRQKSLLILAIILVLPSLLYAWEGRVVSITDGDTIKVLKAGIQVKIRLAAIDCPERGQPYGQAAKKFTANLVAGKIVKVWPTDTDRYGRIVAFIFVGDKNMNKELLSAGLAWHYKKYSRDPELAKLEFQARAKNIGLWSEPDPVTPWEWRKQKKTSN